VSKLDWARSPSADAPAEYPWVEACRQGVPRKGVLLELSMADGSTRKFVVNSAPIVDGKATVRGVIATFDDVTALEETNSHLRELTRELEESQREVTRQNHELRHLAERDPLTSCFNRRAFFARVEAAWAAAHGTGQAVGCIMVDIDRFKSVNDNHGHTVGDQVIQVVARTLGSTLRITDVLGRYGGEEFCILLPGLGTTETAEVAERLRGAIETHGGPAIRTVSDLRVTASFGVASYRAAAGIEPGQLIDHADQALVRAKQTGRNRVVRWDEVGEDQGSRDGEHLAVGVPA
jgi:diguanylate cyclase (GGDEF)-like protein